MRWSVTAAPVDEAHADPSPRLVDDAGLAQWQSNRLVSGRSWVQPPQPALGHGFVLRPTRIPSGVLVSAALGGHAVGVITERQVAILELERTWWQSDEPKEQVIRARFHCSPDEYHAELNEVLELPEALDHDPLVVQRLRRQRDRRRRDRLNGSGSV